MIVYILIATLLIAAIFIFTHDSTDSKLITNEPAPNEYRYFYGKKGVVVYMSWVVVNERTTAVNLKVVNKNDHSVAVSWKGPQWYSKGLYVRNQNKSGTDLNKNDYSNELMQHDKGNNDCFAEVYPGMPNFLYFDAPEGSWKPGQLTITLTNFDVQSQEVFNLTTA